jgi:hypothetical protein
MGWKGVGAAEGVVEIARRRHADGREEADEVSRKADNPGIIAEKPGSWFHTAGVPGGHGVGFFLYSICGLSEILCFLGGVFR